MGIVSARISDAVEARLKQAGVNVSEILRRAAVEEARRLAAKDAMDELDEIASRAKPAKASSETMVREMRDAE